MLCLMIFIC